jgi:hypothetical protein
MLAFAAERAVERILGIAAAVADLAHLSVPFTATHRISAAAERNLWREFAAANPKSWSTQRIPNQTHLRKRGYDCDCPRKAKPPKINIGLTQAAAHVEGAGKL